MNSADIRKIKRLAERIGVHDSDVIRFAIKNMLSQLGPLYDPENRGHSLVPVFVESGAELVRFFELDAMRLEAIINDGVEAGKRVDRGDIALLALAGGGEQYAALMLTAAHHRDGHPSPPGEGLSLVRRYFYDKYLRRGHNDGLNSDDGVRFNGTTGVP
jgi:hypothetical protein